MAVNFAYTMQACCITSLSRFKEWAQYFVAALTFDLQIREKEEDMKILEYIRAKDAREQEIAFEKERIRHEKEMETVRLRTMQVRSENFKAQLEGTTSFLTYLNYGMPATSRKYFMLRVSSGLANI
eukprot:1158380-Pelagomonas_calceolata.AAC.7